MSGNLCKTTTPGANESDFCRQVWSQSLRQTGIRSLPWRLPGLALVRVATGLECPCMNASSTYPLRLTHSQSTKEGRECSVFLAIDRGQYQVCAKRGLWQATKENESKTINHLLRWGQEEIEKKSPANTTCLSPNGTHRWRATRAMKSNRLKTWSAHHEHFADGPVHQQHPRLPNPSRFTGFVVREHLASDERGRSVSQSSGSGKTLRQKFSHHQRQLCFLRCVRMTTDLPMDCRRAPWKNTLWPDRTRETTASCSSMMIQGNRPLDRCDDPHEHTPGQRCSSKTKRSSKRTNLMKERDPWGHRTRTVTASTSTSSTSTEASSRFSVPWSWSWRKAWRPGYRL